MDYKKYTNYGTYKVTTEGDCEGRSIRDLGVHTGYIDEIAFALADKCYYSLRFKQVDPTELDLTPKKDTVEISLDIDSGTWNLDCKIDNVRGESESLKYFRDFFKDRDIEVLSATGYGSCTISTNKETIEEKKSKALKKLTDEEKKLLGLM